MLVKEIIMKKVCFRDDDEDVVVTKMIVMKR